MPAVPGGTGWGRRRRRFAVRSPGAGDAVAGLIAFAFVRRLTADKGECNGAR